jgi:hypothetical protein
MIILKGKINRKKKLLSIIKSMILLKIQIILQAPE